MSNTIAREQKRRLKIKASILESILKSSSGKKLYYAVEALKRNSSKRVSTQVLEEIIRDSPLLQDLDPTTGTTRLNGFPIELEYTLTTTNTLQISEANIGGRKAVTTTQPKLITDAIMTFDGFIEIIIEANPGQGKWELTIVDITQSLNDGSTQKRKVSSTKHPLIKVVASNNDRFYSGAVKTDKV